MAVAIGLLELGIIRAANPSLKVEHAAGSLLFSTRRRAAFISNKQYSLKPRCIKEELSSPFLQNFRSCIRL